MGLTIRWIENGAARIDPGKILSEGPHGTSVEEVHVLDVSRNAITTLRGLCVFNHLKVVILSANKLQSPLSGLPLTLSTLDISSNLLSDLRGIEGLEHLTNLDASFNQLEDESLRIFTQAATASRSIRHLSLNGNKITRAEGLGALKRLETLSMRGNQISRIFDIRDLVMNEALIELNVEGNPLTDYQHYRQECLHLLPSLTVIDEQIVSNKTESSRHQSSVLADHESAAPSASDHDSDRSKNLTSKLEIIQNPPSEDSSRRQPSLSPSEFPHITIQQPLTDLSSYNLTALEKERQLAEGLVRETTFRNELEKEISAKVRLQHVVDEQGEHLEKWRGLAEFRKEELQALKEQNGDFEALLRNTLTRSRHVEGGLRLRAIDQALSSSLRVQRQSCFQRWRIGSLRGHMGRVMQESEATSTKYETAITLTRETCHLLRRQLSTVALSAFGLLSNFLARQQVKIHMCKALSHWRSYCINQQYVEQVSSKEQLDQKTSSESKKKIALSLGGLSSDFLVKLWMRCSTLSSLHRWRHCASQISRTQLVSTLRKAGESHKRKGHLRAVKAGAVTAKLIADHCQRTIIMASVHRWKNFAHSCQISREKGLSKLTALLLEGCGSSLRATAGRTLGVWGRWVSQERGLEQRQIDDVHERALETKGQLRLNTSLEILRLSSSCEALFKQRQWSHWSKWASFCAFSKERESSQLETARKSRRSVLILLRCLEARKIILCFRKWTWFCLASEKARSQSRDELNRIHSANVAQNLRAHAARASLYSCLLAWKARIVAMSFSRWRWVTTSDTMSEKMFVSSKRHASSMLRTILTSLVMQSTACSFSIWKSVVGSDVWAHRLSVVNDRLASERRMSTLKDKRAADTLLRTLLRGWATQKTAGAFRVWALFSSRDRGELNLQAERKKFTVRFDRLRSKSVRTTISTVVRQWSRLRQVHALNKWSSHSRTVRFSDDIRKEKSHHTLQKLSLNLRRLVSLSVSRAFRTWIRSVSARVSSEAKEKLDKTINALQRSVTRQRKHSMKVGIDNILKRWTQAKVASAMSKWREFRVSDHAQARESRAKSMLGASKLKHHLRSALHSHLAKGWRTWVRHTTHVGAEKEIHQLQAKEARATRQLAISTRKSAQRSVSHVIRSWVSRKLAGGFRKWKEFSGDRKASSAVETNRQRVKFNAVVNTIASLRAKKLSRSMWMWRNCCWQISRLEREELARAQEQREHRIARLSRALVCSLRLSHLVERESSKRKGKALSWWFKRVVRTQAKEVLANEKSAAAQREKAMEMTMAQVSCMLLDSLYRKKIKERKKDGFARWRTVRLARQFDESLSLATTSHSLQLRSAAVSLVAFAVTTIHRWRKAQFFRSWRHMAHVATLTLTSDATVSRVEGLRRKVEEDLSRTQQEQSKELYTAKQRLLTEKVHNRKRTFSFGLRVIRAFASGMSWHGKYRTLSIWRMFLHHDRMQAVSENASAQAKKLNELQKSVVVLQEESQFRTEQEMQAIDNVNSSRDEWKHKCEEAYVKLKEEELVHLDLKQRASALALEMELKGREVSALKGENDAVKKETERLREELRKADDRWEFQKADLRKAVEARSIIAATVEEEKLVMEEKERHIKVLEGRVGELSKSNQLLIKEIDLLKLGAEKSKSSSEVSHQQTIHHKEQLGMVLEEKANLQLQLTTALQDKRAAEVEIEPLKNKISALQQEVDSLNHYNAMSKDEIRRANEEVSSTRSQLQESQRNLGGDLRYWKESAESARGEHQKLSAQLEEMKDKLEKVTSSTSGIEKQLSEAREASGKWEEECHKLKQQLSAESALRTAAEKESRREQTNSVLSMSVLNSGSKIGAALGGRSGEKGDASKLLIQFGQDQGSLVKDLMSLQVASGGNTEDGYSQCLGRISETLQRTVAQLSKEVERREQLEADLEKVTEERDSVCEGLQRVGGEGDRLEREASHLRGEVERLSHDLEKAREFSIVAQKDAESLRECLRVAEAAKSRALGDLEGERTHVQEREHYERGRLDTMLREIQLVSTDLHASREEVRALEAQVVTLKESNNCALKERDAALGLEKDMKKEIKGLTSLLETTKSKLREAEIEISRLQSRGELDRSLFEDRVKVEVEKVATKKIRERLAVPLGKDVALALGDKENAGAGFGDLGTHSPSVRAISYGQYALGQAKQHPQVQVIPPQPKAQESLVPRDITNRRHYQGAFEAGASLRGHVNTTATHFARDSHPHPHDRPFAHSPGVFTMEEIASKKRNINFGADSSVSFHLPPHDAKFAPSGVPPSLPPQAASSATDELSSLMSEMKSQLDEAKKIRDMNIETRTLLQQVKQGVIPPERVGQHQI